MKEVFTADVARYILYCAPDAIAWISGSEAHPRITGKVYFWQMKEGVFVEVEVKGLPDNSKLNCNHKIFTLHIHEGSSYTGNSENAFADVDRHYNTGSSIYPLHEEELPSLFSNNGVAWYAVLSNRFKLVDVIGCTVIIHSEPDNFTIQSLEMSVTELACGIIKVNQYS